MAGHATSGETTALLEHSLGAQASTQHTHSATLSNSIMETLQHNSRKISKFVYFLVMMFAISSWIDLNGVWVELPLLVNDLPEGWKLPSFMVIVIQIANIGPLLYTLGHYLAPTKVTEVPVIFGIISVGAVSSVLLVCMWDRTSVILGQEHSTALLTLTGLMSLVDCTSSVVYLPYMQRLLPHYISALYIGEGLSGLIPGLVGLAQGVGGNPTCANSSRVMYNASTDTNTTEWWTYPVYPPPRFSFEAFFLLLFVMLSLSGLAFGLLHYLPFCRALAHVSCPHGLTTEVNPSGRYQSVNQLEKKMFEKEDGADMAETLHSGTALCEPARPLRALSRTQVALLFGLTAWLSALTNGVLPSTQTYSCLPYGHLAYTLSVRLSTIVNPLACALVLFVPGLGVPGVSALIAAASVPASYLLVLAALSPAPPLQHHALGPILVIVCSVIMTALFSYAKVSIAVLLREGAGHMALLWCGFVTQAGALCGAIITFIVINVLQLLTSMQPCAGS